MEEEVNFEDLVIGDLIKLSYGNQVPVDVIVITQHSSVKVDESSVTGESNLIEKCTLFEAKRVYTMLTDMDHVNPGNKGVARHLNTNLNASMSSLTSDTQVMSCVLISGSTISEGGLYGFVVSVGEGTYIRQQTKLDCNVQTPLQEKLEVIAYQISIFGGISGLLTILIMWSKLLYFYF